MKKVLKKLTKAILIIMLLLAMDISLVLNSVQAMNLSKEKVYEIDYCDKVLSYKGIPRGAVYVVYENDGEQYPAYCINPERIGVGETDSYEVSINGNITDVMLWRIIINGYPYRTLGELGVANPKEAYLATKQAIYCYLDNRDINQYSGIGEAGARTLNAMKKIWNNAHNSADTKISNIVDIIPTSSEWNPDNLSSEYISKTYKIQAPAPIVDYEVKIKGENLPEGLIITDIYNNESQVFSPYQEFKILIPINQLKRNGNFEINVATKMDTKPVLYGVSDNQELQNYALTVFSFEDSKGTYIEQYEKNQAKIKILKRDKETKKPLEGVEFQLLDNDKNIILQSLITDKNGEISLKNITPGIYYLEEVRTRDGYVLYDEHIKIDVHLNEQINIVVNNSKEKKIEVSKEVTNIEVGKTEESTKEIINETNINKETSETTIRQEINKIDIIERTNTKNIKRLPKTGM